MIFRVRDQEGRWQHSATREEPPLTVTREEPEQQRRPSTAKNKNKQKDRDISYSKETVLCFACGGGCMNLQM